MSAAGTSGNARLVAWREAYLRGGLPLPARADRWHVLRAGVAGLWEFETAEYWYADGWVQLTGRNETGKSSLMALTTLIPWLADVSPNNIDTLGASTRGKNFRYYVEPSTSDGDRRSAETTTNRGWIWVEYGRLDGNSEPSYFTTLGFFEARRANQSDYTRQWVTVQGPERVRSGLDLVVERSVQTAKGLDKAVPAARLHRSGSVYREFVARHLLDAEPRDLEAVGKLLRVIRTPKLGQSLSEGFVTEKLRDSLPGLDPLEVSKLAAGWDELEKVRQEMETTKSAVDALGRYLRFRWRPYVTAELRRAADQAAAARSRFDQVARRVREATEQREQVQTELGEVTAERDRRGAALAADERAHDDLKESSQYREASQRLSETRRIEDELAKSRGRLAEAERQQARSSERLDQAVTRAAAATTAHTQALDVLATRTGDLATALEPAGLAAHEAAAHSHDWVLLDRLLTDRRTRLTHLDQLFRAHDADDRAAKQAEDRADHAQRMAADAATDAETAWREAGDKRESLTHDVSTWTSGLPAELAAPDGLIDALVDALPRQADDADPQLADRIRTRWHEPHRGRLEDSLRDNAAQLQATAEAIAEVDRETSELRAAKDPVVAPSAGLNVRTRPAPGPTGAPLWRILDAPSSDPTQLAAIEAGLTAMGLIDAWVNPDGLYVADRDGLDTVLLAGLSPVEGTSLADLLACVDELEPLRKSVTRLLRSIAWNRDGAYAINADGSWRTPDRAGRAELLAGEAELIGETARRRARERRLAQLEAERTNLERQRVDLEDARTALLNLRDRLNDLLLAAPNDQPLRRLLGVAAERDRRAELEAAAALLATQQAEERRAEANRSRAAAFDYANDHSLPSSDIDRNSLRQHLADARDAVRAGEHAEQLVTERARAREQAEAERATRLEEHQAASAVSTAAATEVAGLERSAEVLRAQLGADDAQVLDQVKRLAQAIVDHRHRLTDVGERREQLIRKEGRAIADLQAAEELRAEREDDRNTAYDAFQQLLDAGAADELDLSLPQADSRTVEATRSQVAAVREQPPPRNWPDDKQAQDDEVQKHRDRIRNLEELRVLEATGRAVTLNTSGRLPQVEIVLDATGASYRAKEAARRLESIHHDLRTAYDDTIRRNLEELLGSTFIDHLRRQLASAYQLVNEINEVLSRHPTGTTRTVLRIDLKPVEGSSGDVLETLRGSASLMDPATAEQVRAFLGNRIEEARQNSVSAGEVEWGDRLAEALDYRTWWDVRLAKRAGEGGRWSPMNAASYALQSGGARVVMLMLPLVATLAALYRSMPSAPHPFWLDEAFDGLDQPNRQMVLELLAEFDFDVLLAGPGRLLNSSAVPTAAIYQVVRADYPHPGADLTCELWAGGELTPLRVDEVALTVADDDDSLFAGL